MKSKKLLLSLICIGLLVTGGASAMEDGGSSRDPLARLNYRKAYEQKDIHQKFAGLMHQWAVVGLIVRPVGGQRSAEGGAIQPAACSVLLVVEGMR